MGNPVKKVLKAPINAVKDAGGFVKDVVADPFEAVKDAADFVGDNAGRIATGAATGGLSEVGRLGIKKMTPKVPKPGDVNIEVPEDPGQARDAQIVEEESPTPEFGGTGEGEGLRSKKKGRKSLRIDLRTGNAGAGGSGLNIPRS